MKRLAVLLFVLPFMLANCVSDKSLPSGYEGLNRKDKGELLSTTLKAVRVDNFWRSPAVGTSGTILLGQHNNISAHAVLRFFPQVQLDTASVQSAELIFNHYSSWGQGDSLKIAVYPMTNSEWDENTVSWPVIEQNGYEKGNELIAFSLPKTDSGTVKTDFPADIVNDWIEQGSNNGILLFTRQAAFMAGYLAYESAENQPAYLRISYYPKGQTELDTIQVGAIEDASLFDYDTEIPANQLLKDSTRFNVGNLTGYRGLLEFDLSEIPSQAFIHQAVLTLYVDQEQSQTDDEGMVISAAAVFEDSTWSPSTLRADSLNFIPQSVAVNSNQTIEFTDTQAIKNMTSIVQFWILETWPNNGLLIRSSEYGRNISSMSFYGLADTEKRPTLEIIYSLPASSRFEL